MTAPTFDLQSHSVHSDGALAPADVVAAAAAAGVELLALSDHDTSAGVPEARDAARAAGIGLVDATEITTAHNGQQDLHILGYLIDPEHPGLAAALEHSRGDRERRAERMAARLRELGYELDDEQLAARTAQGKTIGRPHLAQAATSHPANQDRLRQEGLLEPTKFLVEYLIDGKAAFVDREAPSVEEAVQLIHDAGGVAVWAHPFWDIPEVDDVRATIDVFRGTGLTASRCSTRRSPPTRCASSRRSAPTTACSPPAPPTSTGQSTTPSPSSARSTCTGWSRTSAPSASRADSRRARTG